MASVRGEPPRALVCPITLDLMRDPVMDANGHTFERSAIKRSLVDRPGICPLTNERYPKGDACLTPNRAVRDIIDAFNEAAGKTALLLLSSVRTMKYTIRLCLQKPTTRVPFFEVLSFAKCHATATR
jgi:hypothetical protein